MATNIVTLRNAGSDIEILIDTFKKIHLEFKNYSFNMEDLGNLAADQNLMASNGRVGEEARERSYRENSSLDSMKMQFKAYAEIFRLLGWIRSISNNNRTTYRITFLGNCITTTSNTIDIVRESFLGIDLPNGAVQRDCTNSVRLLWCYLRLISSVSYYPEKLDFIYLCHGITNDEDTKIFSHMINELENFNQSNNKLLSKAVDNLAKSAQPKPLKVNTLGNSTRLTISALKKFNWTTSPSRGRFSLSPYGKTIVDTYNNYYRPKYTDVIQWPIENLSALSKVGLIQLLQRAAYNTNTLEKILDYNYSLELLVDKNIISSVDTPILFSPYQVLDPDVLNIIFGNNIDTGISQYTRVIKKELSESKITDQIINSYIQSYPSNIQNSLHNNLSTIIEKEVKRTNDIEIVIKNLLEYYRPTKQNIFYQCIVDAFNILGFHCELTRSGQNSLRWDAMIKDTKFSIPIEIKSPTEEEYLSVKGVRQALENRVMLQARQTFPTTIDTSSFVVGYKYPAARAESHELINDIYSVYGINIALFSFEVLLRLVLARLLNDEQIDQQDFIYLKGIIELKDKHNCD